MSPSVSGPIKIVHLITGLSAGGAELMLARLVAEMDRSRFENHVISLTDLGMLGCAIEARGVPVYTLGVRQESTTSTVSVGKFLYLLVIGLWKLVSLLRQERPHILQSWLYHSDLLGILAGRLAGVPVVVWNLRCTESNARRSLAMLLLAWLSGYPDVVVVNSMAGRRYHEDKGYRPKRWEHIPNGIDTEQFRPDASARRKVRDDLGVGQDCLLIGLIGRYHPLKDIETFLRAAAIIHASCPDAQYVMVGSGFDRENFLLAERITQLKLGSYVHLLGRRNDVPTLGASFDIGVLSSSSEGFPNVVGEMMACSVPCIVTDVGDAGVLVGETGRVVPPGKPAALAKACLELILAGDCERQRLGAQARSRIVEHFDLRTIVTRYEDLYASGAPARAASS